MTLLKRLKTLGFTALSGLALWASPGWAAGTTPLALAIQYDTAGNLAPGCQLNFYVAGTVATQQNAYADFGLTTPLPNPLPCDQSGRVPMHWLADGLIHIRLTDSSGGPIVDTTMQVLGPSSGGGGGGGTVDPTAVMQTGDLKVRYSTGTVSGFVRANYLTIGNATSGATERANADTQALFIQLYNADPNLNVVGGRSGNALNDFNAGKQLNLPDWRGRAIGALADMGNTPTGTLTAAGFGASPTVLGVTGGNQTPSITQTYLPPVTLGVSGSASVSVSVSGSASVSVSGGVTGSTSGYTPTVGGIQALGVASGTSAFPFTNSGPGGVFANTQFGNVAGFSSLSVSGSFSGTGTGSSTGTGTGSGSITGSTAALGSGNPFPTVPPMMLATIYIKL